MSFDCYYNNTRYHIYRDGSPCISAGILIRRIGNVTSRRIMAYFNSDINITI